MFMLVQKHIIVNNFHKNIVMKFALITVLEYNKSSYIFLRRIVKDNIMSAMPIWATRIVVVEEV